RAARPTACTGNAAPGASLLLDSSETSAESAIASANHTLADYQKIRTWFVWPDPDFPRTPTGKPRLALIAARAAELLEAEPGFGPAPDPSASATDPLARFTSSTSLASLSSLDRV